MARRDLSTILSSVMDTENNSMDLDETNMSNNRRILNADLLNNLRAEADLNVTEVLKDIKDFKIKNSSELPIYPPFTNFYLTLEELFDEYDPNDLTVIKDKRDLTTLLYTLLVHGYTKKANEDGDRIEIIEMLCSMLLTAKSPKDLDSVLKCISNDHQVITVSESRKRVKMLMNKFSKKPKVEEEINAEANDDDEANSAEIVLEKYKDNPLMLFETHFKVLPKTTAELVVKLMNLNDFVNSFSTCKDVVVVDVRMSKVKLKEDVAALQVKFSKPILIPLDLVCVKDTAIELFNARQGECQNLIKSLMAQLDCSGVNFENNCHSSIYISKLKNMGVVKINDQLRDNNFNTGLIDSNDVKSKQVFVFIGYVYITSSEGDLKQKHSIRAYPLRFPNLPTNNSTHVLASLNFYNQSIAEDRLVV